MTAISKMDRQQIYGTLLSSLEAWNLVPGKKYSGYHLSIHDYLDYYDIESLGGTGTLVTSTAGMFSDTIAEKDYPEILSKLFINEYQFDQLTFVEEIQGTHFNFNRYKFQGDTQAHKTILDIYTTTFEGELIFILTEQTNYISGEFHGLYESVIRSMHIER